MLTLVRNQLIRMAFHLWVLSLQMRRAVRRLGRLKIGVLDHVTIPVHDRNPFPFGLP